MARILVRCAAVGIALVVTGALAPGRRGRRPCDRVLRELTLPE